MLYFIFRIILYIPIAIILFPAKIYGKKNKKIKGKLIFCGNHRSNLDIVTHLVRCPTIQYTLAKKELFHPKFWGWILKAIGGIEIDRDGADLNALKTCMKKLKMGKKLFIFPEGTRNTTDAELLPLKSGTALLAIKTKTPIVPVAFYRKKNKVFHKTYILYGEPFELSQFYNVKLNEKTLKNADDVLRDKMLENIHNLQNILNTKKKSAKNV